MVGPVLSLRDGKAERSLAGSREGSETVLGAALETILVVLGDLERKSDCDGKLLGSLDPVLGPVLGDLEMEGCLLGSLDRSERGAFGTTVRTFVGGALGTEDM